MAWSDPRTWVTNEIVTAAHMNQEVRDNLDAALPDAVSVVSWAPNLEGSTSGSLAASSGRRWIVGALEFVWARFVGPTDLGGTFFVTLPSTVVGLSGATSIGSGQAVGSWQYRDDTNTAGSEGGTVLLRSTTAVHFNRPVGGLVSDATFPGVTSSDVLSFHAVYPIA